MPICRGALRHKKRLTEEPHHLLRLQGSLSEIDNAEDHDLHVGEGEHARA